MKRRGWICLILFIILQIIKSLIIEEWLRDYGEGRIEVKMNENSTLDFETLAFNEGYEQIKPAVLGSRLYKIKGKIELDVLGIGTNNYFNEAEALQFRNGAFFGQQAVKEGRNAAVISDQLSQKLFGSDKGTGSICTIDAITYQIVGVYKKDKEIIAPLLDDGRERVYFPITSTAARDLKVQTLLISSKNRKEPLDINQLQQLQVSSGNSFIYNALDAGKKLRTLVQLPLNLLALLITWHLIRINIQLLKGQNARYRRKIIVTICCVAIICFILSVGIKPLYISREALPSYNIFDICFYIKYFKSQCIVYNHLLELNLSDFSKVYSMNRNSIIAFSVIQMVCCLKIRTDKEILLKRREGKE